MEIYFHACKREKLMEWLGKHIRQMVGVVLSGSHINCPRSRLLIIIYELHSFLARQPPYSTIAFFCERGSTSVKSAFYRHVRTKETSGQGLDNFKVSLTTSDWR